MEVNKLTIDPICKMNVDDNIAQFKTEHMGKTYYFCCSGCKDAFEKEPMKYMHGEHDHNGKHHDEHHGHDM
jgi:YHS domain-containing protein